MLRSLWMVVLLGLAAFVLYEKHFVAEVVDQPSARARLAPSQDQATSSPIRICSQNLFRFGAKRTASTKKRSQQKRYLIDRMERARCDVVALQELGGPSELQAKRIAIELADGLSSRAESKFRYYIGKSHDRYIRNAFLVRESLGHVRDVKHFYRHNLSRVSRGRSNFSRFSRGPLGILIELPQRSIFVVTMHFKSKRNADRDHTGTKFEVLRLEMAEGLREMVLEATEEYGPDVVPIVLGDRNSDSGSASAVVLEGKRSLADFVSGRCEISERLTAACERSNQREKALVGLFSYGKEKFPREYIGGSYRYRKREQMIDEILIQPQHLNYVARANGKVAIGLEGRFHKGSDHKLLWAEFSL